ncbi:MAG: hypothetical protein J6N21_03170 [Butyrivibrio sp.]|nr:hypothetical protein [Butyrivibrio sp.]MBP3195986.1 hypothetical protein [Butyrivibrio sp.]
MVFMKNWQHCVWFLCGVLFGTAGVKVLSSKDAKKCYTHTTAAVLRAKDCVMDTANKVQENCDDILAEAKEINAERKAKEDEAVVGE